MSVSGLGSSPPRWVDDLFPFPTPQAFRTLIDIAWEREYEFYLENGSYDFIELSTRFDFMFDLERFPAPLDGWDPGYPEFTEECRQPSAPMFATPEFVPFGSLGTGSCVGWLVPAPELQRPDQPVALASGHFGGVTWLGPDTRTGLEVMLSWTLRRWREDPKHWADTIASERPLVDRLAAELGVHPDPDKAYIGSSWKGTTVVMDEEYEIVFDVPQGWHHAEGADGIGVLAPSDAFSGREPIVPYQRVESGEDLEPALADAARALDAGYPATALLGIRDTFEATPSCYFAELKPLWARAYRDLGRNHLTETLDRMESMYQPLSCYCSSPHR
ncbi:hypothetical protein WEI85_27125 [Actinomycetes bacterium KLBMP 9797]